MIIWFHFRYKSIKDIHARLMKNKRAMTEYNSMPVYKQNEVLKSLILHYYYLKDKPAPLPHNLDTQIERFAYKLGRPSDESDIYDSDKDVSFNNTNYY